MILVIVSILHRIEDVKSDIENLFDTIQGMEDVDQEKVTNCLTDYIEADMYSETSLPRLMCAKNCLADLTEDNEDHVDHDNDCDGFVGDGNLGDGEKPGVVVVDDEKPEEVVVDEGKLGGENKDFSERYSQFLFCFSRQHNFRNRIRFDCG